MKGLIVKTRPEPNDVADRGIDGRIYFHDDPEAKEIKEIIVQVKKGGINPGVVRDLKGVIGRENAHTGVLITLQSATRAMFSCLSGTISRRTSRRIGTTRGNGT